MIRVLVIDDSALVRQLLTELLSSDASIEVVGTAPDPYVARQKIKSLNPDVLTLDVEMPRMDGLTFLENLMRLRPLPVVMVSSLTAKGAEATLRAMELGAVDFVTKPQVGVAEGLNAYGEELIEKVKSACNARILQRRGVSRTHSPERLALDIRTTDQVIAIGASTGGTEAIREVLEVLPPDCPPTVITQHIPEHFSASFARRLNELCAMSVCEATDGVLLRSGHAYVAPGDQHLEVVRSGAKYYTRLSSGPPVNRHRPSVDVLFNSVAAACGRNAVGALLTGMGKDGAEGLLAMRNAGARTLAQDEKTSVVWGMPGAAVKIGAAEHVLPLGQIAPNLLRVRRAA